MVQVSCLSTQFPVVMRPGGICSPAMAPAAGASFPCGDAELPASRYPVPGATLERCKVPAQPVLSSLKVSLSTETQPTSSHHHHEFATTPHCSHNHARSRRQHQAYLMMPASPIAPARLLFCFWSSMVGPRSMGPKLPQGSQAPMPHARLWA